jgi:hypothetical protein
MVDTPNLRPLIEQAEALQQGIETVYRQTQYEDLDHAVTAMSIVRHALHEVEEHTGLGGTMPKTPDPERLRAAQNLLRQVEALRKEAEQLLAQAHQEDLQTAIQALHLATGSLHEVAEQYE